MSVKLPPEFVICPHCGIVLSEYDGVSNPPGLTYLRIMSGKGIVCPSCGLKFTSKAKVLDKIPKLPEIVEVVCSNPDCLEYYSSDINDAGIIFDCLKCKHKLKYPIKTNPADQIDIQSIFQDVTMNTPLVSLVGILAITRAGLFHFITGVKPGNDKSRLGKDGDGLYERIKPYILNETFEISEKITAIKLKILSGKYGFWSILEKYFDYIKISPLDLSEHLRLADETIKKQKSLKLLQYNIISLQYGTLSIDVKPKLHKSLTKALNWFISASKYYKPVYDALFFEPPVKYSCECGKAFKSYACAIGLPAICGNCGRKIVFRHRPFYKLQDEINTGTLVPKELTFRDKNILPNRYKFSVCTSCSKWTWIDNNTIVDTPICRFCKTPVNMGSKPSDWFEYSCPHCSSKIVVPAVFGGCEAVCKQCGKASLVPKAKIR